MKQIRITGEDLLEALKSANGDSSKLAEILNRHECSEAKTKVQTLHEWLVQQRNEANKSAEYLAVLASGVFTKYIANKNEETATIVMNLAESIFDAVEASKKEMKLQMAEGIAHAIAIA